MGIFKSIGSTIENLRNSAQEYIETQVKLFKLQAAEKVSALVAAMAAYMILSFFLLFFLLFASIAGAYVLSEMIGRPYAGFLIVSGIYLLTGLIIFINREKLLRRPLLNAIIRQLFKDNPNDNSKNN